MALEITIWSQNDNEVKALGETVIPIESGIAHNTDWWPLLAANYIYTVNHSPSMDYIGEYFVIKIFPIIKHFLLKLYFNRNTR